MQFDDLDVAGAQCLDDLLHLGGGQDEVAVDRRAAAVVVSCSSAQVRDTGELPLRRVSETPLTGGTVRFDYLALDAGRGLLFVAHMGAGQLVEVDVRAHTVVRTPGDLPDVHGVIVVPDKHRVYATATGRNQMVAVDEDSGAVVFTAPTDAYPVEQLVLSQIAVFLDALLVIALLAVVIRACREPFAFRHAVEVPQAFRGVPLGILHSTEIT